MKPTRRNLLAMGGGAMAGLIFTPVPWKVLDDVSIRTQTWPRIPQPARGPVEVKNAACTLCPHGCGLRVRMAARWPVGLSGMPGHPVSRGALCPLAFGAHQLNWHPRRVRAVRHRGRPASWEGARAALRKASTEGPIAIWDGRAGRAASAVFESFAARHNGSYRAILTAEERALLPYQRWSGVPVQALGYDLDAVRTIISFGAPLLDGWGPPGRFTRLWSERDIRVIQVEPSLSRTAACAWRWVPNRPGAEAALASALGRILIEERLVSAGSAIPQPDVAPPAGLTAEEIRALARQLVERQPVLAVAAGDTPAVAALNLLLGGKIVRHAASRTAATIDLSPRAVLVDATVPWSEAPPAGAEVFRFAAWDGGAPEPDWLLPAPGFLEEVTDIPTAPASAIATYSLAPALLDPAEGVSGAAAFLASLDPKAGSADSAIRARCEELFRSRSGILWRPPGEEVPVTDMESAAKLRDELLAGAIWMDHAPPGELRCELKEWPADTTPAHAVSWAANWVPPVLPPLATKLYQESTLRSPAPERRSL